MHGDAWNVSGNLQEKGHELLLIVDVKTKLLSIPDELFVYCFA